MTATQTRPNPGPVRPYHFPLAQRTVLSNGLSVMSAPISRVPLTSVVVLIDAGAVCEPAGQEGVARLVAKLLLQGAEGDNGASLAERLEQLGASVDADASWDVAMIRVTVLSEHLPRALELLSAALRRPTFEEREVTRLTAERHAEVLQLQSEPRGLA